MSDWLWTGTRELEEAATSFMQIVQNSQTSEYRHALAAAFVRSSSFFADELHLICCASSRSSPPSSPLATLGTQSSPTDDFASRTWQKTLSKSIKVTLLY